MSELTPQPVVFRILDDGTRPILETELGKQFYIDEHGRRRDGVWYIPHEISDELFDVGPVIVHLPPWPS